jgi:hypothetical protein
MWIMTARGWRPLYRECVNSNAVEGTFEDVSLEERQSESIARAERFVVALAEFHPVHNAGEFRGDHFIDRGFPCYDAFGRRM